MANPNKPSYTHGSTGTQPASAIDYANGDPVDADNLDYFVNTQFEKIKQIIDQLEAIDSDGDGVVDAADAATDADASTYKGNDIDTDGNGVVDAADDANTLAGNGPDHYELDVEDDGTLAVSAVPNVNFGSNISVSNDGDGTVTVSVNTSTDTRTGISDSGTTVVSNTADVNLSTGFSVLDDADGTVTINADQNATTFKGNDIDTDGDGRVDAADTATETQSIEARTSDPSSPSVGRVWIRTDL